MKNAIVDFKPDATRHAYPNYLRADAPIVAVKIDFDRCVVSPVAVSAEESARSADYWRCGGAILAIACGINDQTLLGFLRRRAQDLEEGISFGMMVKRHAAEAADVRYSLSCFKTINEKLTWAFFKLPFRYGRMPKAYTAALGRDFSRLYEKYLEDLFEVIQDRAEETDAPILRYEGCREDLNVLFVNFLMKKLHIKSASKPWMPSKPGAPALPLMENLAAFALLRYLDLLPACGITDPSVLRFPLYASKLSGSAASDRRTAGTEAVRTPSAFAVQTAKTA